MTIPALGHVHKTNTLTAWGGEVEFLNEIISQKPTTGFFYEIHSSK